MLCAMKPSLAPVLCLLVPGTAFGQAARPPIGVCLDPDRFEAAQAAGFDYVETNASKVAVIR